MAAEGGGRFCGHVLALLYTESHYTERRLPHFTPQFRKKRQWKNSAVHDITSGPGEGRTRALSSGGAEGTTKQILS